MKKSILLLISIGFIAVTTDAIAMPLRNFITIAKTWLLRQDPRNFQNAPNINSEQKKRLAAIVMEKDSIKKDKDSIIQAREIRRGKKRLLARIIYAWMRLWHGKGEMTESDRFDDEDKRFEILMKRSEELRKEEHKINLSLSESKIENE